MASLVYERENCVDDFVVFLPFLSWFTRDHEVREHIPVPYDNLFQSILSYASRSQCYF